MTGFRPIVTPRTLTTSVVYLRGRSSEQQRQDKLKALHKIFPDGGVPPQRKMKEFLDTVEIDDMPSPEEWQKIYPTRPRSEATYRQIVEEHLSNFLKKRELKRKEASPEYALMHATKKRKVTNSATQEVSCPYCKYKGKRLKTHLSMNTSCTGSKLINEGKLDIAKVLEDAECLPGKKSYSSIQQATDEGECPDPTVNNPKASSLEAPAFSTVPETPVPSSPPMPLGMPMHFHMGMTVPPTTPYAVLFFLPPGTTSPGTSPPAPTCSPCLPMQPMQVAAAAAMTPVAAPTHTTTSCTSTASTSSSSSSSPLPVLPVPVSRRFFWNEQLPVVVDEHAYLAAEPDGVDPGYIAHLNVQAVENQLQVPPVPSHQAPVNTFEPPEDDITLPENSSNILCNLEAGDFLCSDDYPWSGF